MLEQNEHLIIELRWPFVGGCGQLDMKTLQPRKENPIVFSQKSRNCEPMKFADFQRYDGCCSGQVKKCSRKPE